jgi:hypothetical protein
MYASSQYINIIGISQICYDVIRYNFILVLCHCEIYELLHDLTKLEKVKGCYANRHANPLSTLYKIWIKAYVSAKCLPAILIAPVPPDIRNDTYAVAQVYISTTVFSSVTL